MADRSNYADKPISEERTGALTEHRLNLGNDARGFTPNAGETDGEGRHGNLGVSSTGDWCWQPARNKSFGQFEMPALTSTLRGMPEQLGRAREAAGEPSAVRYSNAVLPIRRYAKLIAGVNGGLFDTHAGAHAGAAA